MAISPPKQRDKLPLKKDWDRPPHIRREQGYHVTRKRENFLLVDFLHRRTEGALLLSGKRGVGKTSAVFAAINQVIKLLETDDNDKVTVIPVLVNAPSFDIKSTKLDTNQLDTEDSQSANVNSSLVAQGEQFDKDTIPYKLDLLEFKRIVLQNIVRRLYKVVDEIKNNGKANNEVTIDVVIYDKVSDLFKRAVAKEVKEEIKNEEMQQHNFKVEKEISMNIGASKKILALAVSFISAALISVNPIPGSGNWNNLIAILTGIVPGVVITANWALKKAETRQFGSDQTATSLYLNDYNVTNLQVELEETLDKLAQGRAKVIIIIDELDKMKTIDLINVITSLKTLLNQSSALFLLVIGDKYFREMMERGKLRLKEYTLFSQKIFLQRPLFSEMEEFIDKIVDVPDNSLVLNEDYRKFKNYLCYLSKTDFFDLYNVIRDHVKEYDEKGRPLIDIKLSEQTQVVQSFLQKAMGQIYSLKASSSPSDWYRNDLLLDLLYQLLESFTTNKVGSLCKIKEDKLEINFENGKNPKINDESQMGAVLDFMDYLEKLDFLHLIRPNHYEIRGVIKPVERKPTILTREQYNFVKAYENFITVVLTYANVLRKYGGATFFSQKFTYNDVKDPNLEKINETVTTVNQMLKLSSYVDVSHISDFAKKYKHIKGFGDSSSESSPEKLVANTQTLEAAYLNYINNFILLLKAAFEIGLGPLPTKGTTPVLAYDVTDPAFSDLVNIPVSSDTSTSNNKVLVITRSDSRILAVQNPSALFSEMIERKTESKTFDLRALIMEIDPNQSQELMTKFDTIDTDKIAESDYSRLNSFLQIGAPFRPPPVVGGAPSGDTATDVPVSSKILKLKIPEDWKLFHRVVRNLF